MQQGQEWFNFINSLDSPATRKSYSYRLEEFLQYCKLDLHDFLNRENKENLITEYLVQKKVSKATKNLIFYSIKHACIQNDIVLNWDKIHKFIRSTKTGNEISGKDRPYTTEEIQQILSFSDQRIKTAFLILASTGIRIGALGQLRISDLKRIDDLYAISVYSGDYITFTTPEAAKELDSYLEFRKRRNGEHITSDSYLIVKRNGEQFKGDSLKALLQSAVENSGLRTVDHNNPHKHKQVSLFHGFRKWFTKCLVDSNVKAEIREMLLGHKIGLTGVYYRPSEQDMLQEYYKAVPLLTISDKERLQFKLEERVQIEKTQMESMQAQLDEFKKLLKVRKRK